MMTTNKFSAALGNIGDRYIDEAIAYTAKREKKAWAKWVPLAACLLLVIMGGVWGNIWHSPDVPDDNIVSYFVITAHAENGEATELGLSEHCFNSVVLPQGNGFGVDMPLFHFSVRPSDLKADEALYSRFDISVSYNGIQVKDRDAHLSVAYLISTVDRDEPWSYGVTGWFDEPTDIIVNILDKENREIVEAVTVRVVYSADKQGYELEITNWTTKFSEQKGAAEADNALMSYLLREGYVTTYPAWFGGRYIEENKLHIKLVSPTDEEMKKLSKILAPYDDVVVYENAERSMSELQDYADQAVMDLEKLGYRVTSWCVDSVTGNIEIRVLKEDLEAVKLWVDKLSQNTDAPEIKVEIGEYISLD